MDYSAANLSLWNPAIQIGMIAIFILIANVLRRKIPFVQKSMIPTAVLAGFIMLFAKSIGFIKLDSALMEALTYHGIAIGFIAMSLRIPEKSSSDGGNLTGLKSGAVIVSSYMIQAVVGLVITIVLGYTVLPNLFKASGILLPMGFGQGPGQANNIGSSYEALGFAGGRSFGLAIAAAGYLCACIVGVFYINYLARKGQIKAIDHTKNTESLTVDAFQSKEEIPVSESIDRLSIQVCLVLMVYVMTYLVTKGITWSLSTFAPGVGNMLNSLFWGFNFIFGSAFAIALRSILKGLHATKMMHHQYQNNYLLSRISGLAFDIMIVAGIGSIEFEDLSGLWIPFTLMVIAGAVVTLFHLKFVCKRVYKDYYYEGLVSMYGMMTGTISSGVLLLRELDPMTETPAANNLVVGSSFGILLGAPLLVLVSLAPKSEVMTFVVLGIVIVYYFLLVLLTGIKKNK